MVETGFDCEFVDRPPDDVHSECSVCLLVLRQPHLVDCCGNHFCKACLEAVGRTRKVCPLCKHEPFTAILDKGLERLLTQKDVFCTNRKLGCKWTGELSQLESHINEPGAKNERSNSFSGDTTILGGCQFVEVPCKYCSIRFRRCNLKEHYTECLHRLVTCEYCRSYTCPHDELSNHYLQCSMYRVPCANKCGAYLLPTSATKHYSVCPMANVPCPNHCGCHVQRQNVASHLEEECQQSKLPCKYSFAGCKYIATRKRMVQHMRHDMATHLSLVENNISSEVRNLESRNHSLNFQLTRLKREVSQSRKDHVCEVDHLKLVNQDMRDQITFLLAGEEQSSSQIEQLKQTLCQLQKKISQSQEIHAAEVQKLESRNRTLKRQLVCVQCDHKECASQICKLESRNASLEDQSAHLQQQISRLQKNRTSEVQKLELTNQSLKDELTCLLSNREQCASQIVKLESKNATLESQSDRFRQQIRQLRRTHASEVQKLESANQAMKDQLTFLLFDREKRASQVDELETQNGMLDAQLACLHHQTSKMRENHASEVHKLNVTIRSLEMQLAEQRKSDSAARWYSSFGSAFGRFGLSNTAGHVQSSSVDKQN